MIFLVGQVLGFEEHKYIAYGKFVVGNSFRHNRGSRFGELHKKLSWIGIFPAQMFPGELVIQPIVTAQQSKLVTFPFSIQAFDL